VLAIIGKHNISEWVGFKLVYRDASDDGVLTALLLPPLIASGAFYYAFRVNEKGGEWLRGWLIEAPGSDPSTSNARVLANLIQNRRSLLELCCMCSIIHVFQFLASRAERYRKVSLVNDVPATHRSWLTRSEARKVWLYIGFTFIVTLGSISVKMATSTHRYPLLKCAYAVNSRSGTHPLSQI
jgi:dolichol kinase